MTGQTLLNYMEILFPELQLQTGESDVTKGLLALNIAQDGFEALVAQEPEVHCGTEAGVPGTISTTISQEYSTYPAGLLRLDRLQYISPTTGLPIWPIERIEAPGDHSIAWPYALSTASPLMSGIPTRYWDNGTRIYWSPTPNAVSTIRYYGFVAASAITASATFTYPDIVAFPIAGLAVRIIKTGLDDEAGDISGLAKAFLDPVIKSLANHNRDNPRGLRYRFIHRT